MYIVESLLLQFFLLLCFFPSYFVCFIIDEFATHFKQLVFGVENSLVNKVRYHFLKEVSSNGKSGMSSGG